jgi:hypothetical protein
VEGYVLSLIDHAHSAAAELLDDAVMGNRLVGHGWRTNSGAMLGVLRRRSQRGAAHGWKQEGANPTISGFSKPPPIRWSERVSAASPVFAVFCPRFARCLRLGGMVIQHTLWTSRGHRMSDMQLPSK